MSPVRRRDLAVVAAGVAVVGWLLVRRFYGELPALDWWLPVPVGVLAVAEALGARTLRARLAAQRDPRPAAGGRPSPGRPVEPLLVARLVVLAQASAWVGAVVGGLWLGVGAYTLSESGRLADAGSDTVTAGIGAVLSAGLVAAALWLEHVCRVPADRDEDRPGGTGARA